MGLLRDHYDKQVGIGKIDKGVEALALTSARWIGANEAIDHILLLPDRVKTTMDLLSKHRELDKEE